MGNQTPLQTRNLDINITEGQAHWIKYRMWSYKKKKKKKKEKKKKIELVMKMIRNGCP